MDEWREGGREGGEGVEEGGGGGGGGGEGRGRIGNTSCSDVTCAADSYQGPGGVY